MSLSMSALFASAVVERLNNLLIESARLTEDDPEEALFIQTLLSRYVANGRPLTGYFVVCCVIEIQGTVLAQALSPPQNGFSSRTPEEAAAANAVWTRLISRSASVLNIDDKAIQTNLRDTTVSALRCYADLLLQIEEMEGDPSIDTYAWETMSESLVRINSSWRTTPSLLIQPCIETGFRLFRRPPRPRQKPLLAAEVFAQ
jgi:phosphatidylinositol 4-kinase